MGTITLYNQDGRMLYTTSYGSPNHRRAIIAFMGNLYGDAFRKFYYQIAPEITIKVKSKAA